jgi:hypothetical protein
MRLTSAAVVCARVAVAVAGLAALAVAASSCLSPTLPLPPPTVDSAAEGMMAGLWEVSGECQASALVIVFNNNVGSGSTVECSQAGLFHASVPGKMCDEVQVFQIEGNSLSSDTFIALEAYADGSPVDPNACQ